jgi:hypothetical protein
VALIEQIALAWEPEACLLGNMAAAVARPHRRPAAAPAAAAAAGAGAGAGERAALGAGWVVRCRG